MQLKSIELHNFRSYTKQLFTIPSNGVLIIGNNGSGKTNLLEGIAYSGLGKSIRFHGDDDLLRFGESYFSIVAVFKQDTGLEVVVSFKYDKEKKVLTLDGVTEKHLSRVIQMIKIIYCAPEDVNIIGGSPKARRQYFDLAISQVFPDYLHALRAYLHTVQQRNSLLKTPYNQHQKNAWDNQFVDNYLEVLRYRTKYIAMLNTQFIEKYRNISDTIQRLDVKYLMNHRISSHKELNRDILLQLISSLESREKLLERSLIGAHLDDYSLLMNGHELKAYGSGGQKRLIAIFIKLIQASLIHEQTSIKPILLFDDIFAELDEIHVMKVKELIDNRYQILITSPKSDFGHIWTDLTTLQLPVSVNEA